MERKVQLDFIRGFLLVVITINHFLPHDDVMRYFTHEFVGWVTAAAGFVFLSGLTAGLVYTHKLLGKNAAALETGVRRRTWLIYRNHLLLLLLVAAVAGIGFADGFWHKEYVFFTQQPLLAVLLGAALVYQPAYLDILPMYAVFMVSVPLLIKWLHQGYAWRVAAVSITLYLLGFSGSYFQLAGSLTQFLSFEYAAFNLFCWQLLFVAGLLAGYYFYHGKTQKWQTDQRFFRVAVGIAVLLFLLKNSSGRVPGVALDHLTSKANLGHLRLLNFAALAFIVTYVASKRATWFSSKALVYLGRHSLEVFTFHLLLVLLLSPLAGYLNGVCAFKVTRTLYFYPQQAVLLIFGVLPALFLAPTLLKRKTYAALRRRLSWRKLTRLVRWQSSRQGTAVLPYLASFYLARQTRALRWLHHNLG